MLHRTEKDPVICNAKRPEPVGVAKTVIRIDGRNGNKVFGWGRDAVSSTELLKVRADAHRLVSNIENLQDSIHYEKKGRKQRAASTPSIASWFRFTTLRFWMKFVAASIWSLRSVQSRKSTLKSAFSRA